MGDEEKQEQPKVDAVAVIQGVEAKISAFKPKEQKPPEDKEEEDE